MGPAYCSLLFTAGGGHTHHIDPARPMGAVAVGRAAQALGDPDTPLAGPLGTPARPGEPQGGRDAQATPYAGT